MSDIPPLWAVVPAAGIGARMRADRPKQYLPLRGKAILEITLTKLLSLPQLAGVIVATHSEDVWFDSLSIEDSRIHRVTGGDNRARSVLNGLAQVQKFAPQAWVLVHDAARPCVNVTRIERLIDVVKQQVATLNHNGAILAVPAADTLKNVSDQTIVRTVDRANIWQAHTPQLFDVQRLKAALKNAFAHGVSVTDEASAMEAMGYAPSIVVDDRTNIKVTCPEDLALAECILKNQKE